MMGRKLDLSGLTDNEAEHVLEVVKRDMKLRKKEEERLSELRQELDEEGSRCLLLSRQSRFNQRCCIRCCSPFTFLLNPKRTCSDCHYNVCKACRVYNKRDRAWLCSACQKSRLLKTQSLEWFYNNVKRRFKRFGSAKVLKTLYRKHLLEHSTLTELTEGSTYEESVCNEGSICGSDSAFYRQTEEHSMAETLTVALRVAEEAIDEAITKAEFENTTQETQNEAHYLRQHRAELIEELAKTIVQKIISRRKTLAEMRAEYEQDWHNPDLHHHQHHRHEDQASSSLKHQPSLWRSHSAFSLLDNDPPGLIQDSPQALKKEGSGSTLSTWKSVDRLDNAGVSSVLKSPDGNWIALQSAQLSRPSLLAKRKSLVYSALERESAVVSAYEDMGSDNETRPESDSSWGASLQEVQRKMTDSNFNQQDSHGWTASSVVGPGSRHDPIRDSEGNWESSKPLLALLKRSMSAEIRLTSSCRTSSPADVNCNVEGAEEEEETRSHEESPPAVLDCGEDGTQPSSDAVTPDTLTSGATTPDLFDLESDITAHGANQMGQELTVKMQRLTGHDSSGTEEEEVKATRDSGSDAQVAPKRRGCEDRDEEDECSLRMEIDLEEGRAEEEEEEDADDEEVRDRLCRLVAQARLSYFASTDDELDKVGQSEGEQEDDKDRMEEEQRKQQDEKMINLPYKICQLEKEVGASRFSSTEDELDRVGVEDEETRRGEDEEDGIKEELAVKVCRLANQVNATQFSSTEDELDRAGKGDEEEEVMDEEALWKLQAEKAIQAAQLRDLSCLVSAPQFSSTKDQLDGEDEREDDAGLEGGVWERTESFEDLDVKMFDLRDEIEESLKESSNAKVSGEVLNSQTKHVCRTEAREKKEEKKVTAEPGEERLEVGRLYQEKLLREAEEAKETENVRVVHGTEVLQEGEEPEARQEEICEGRQSLDITPGGSDDEDEEFNRIISSMLMMTLEDMQGGIFDKDAAEKARKTEEAGMDGQMDTSEETGSAPESESWVKTMMPASAAEGRRAEREAEKAGGNDRRERQSEDAEDRNTHEEEEKDSDPQEERHLAQEDALVTTGERDLEAERTLGRVEDDRGEDRGGQTADRREDVAEGDGQREEAEEGVESAESLEESWTSNQEETLIRHSALSLRSITTEVLKVLNATEELLQGVEGGPALSAASLPPNTDPKKLDQQFCRLEENVYVAAGAVYSLEAELNDLEECARGISSATSDMELSFLEEQVATAAGKVKQSELQISDISARIAALKSAGLDVDTQSRVNRTRTAPVMPVTLDASRQLRRRLPAPPVKGEKEN